MGWDLGETLDKIQNYNQILTDFGFDSAGPGIKLWSISHVKDYRAIEIQGSGWTYYENGVEISTGDTPETLRNFLKEKEV